MSKNPIIPEGWRRIRIGEVLKEGDAWVDVDTPMPIPTKWSKGQKLTRYIQRKYNKSGRTIFIRRELSSPAR